MEATMNHHLMNYIIGGSAMAIAVGGLVLDHNRIERLMDRTAHNSAAISHLAPGKYSRLAWPALSQEQVIALGEALKKLKPVKTTIFCASENCAALRTDFDDAFQIAGWETDFQDRMWGPDS